MITNKRVELTSGPAGAGPSAIYARRNAPTETYRKAFVLMLPINNLWIRSISVAFSFLLCSTAVFGAEPPFKDYPALEKYKGNNAPLVLTSKDSAFQTRLKAAANTMPNFAGHYIVTGWGCGTECVMFAVIDANTGIVYWSPHSICCWEAGQPVDFRPDSRLIVFSGLLNQEGKYGTHYFEFKNNQFVHVKTDVREFTCEAPSQASEYIKRIFTVRTVDGEPVSILYESAAVPRKKSNDFQCYFRVSKKDVGTTTWKNEGGRIQITERLSDTDPRKTFIMKYTVNRYTLTLEEADRGDPCHKPARMPRSITLLKGKNICEFVE